MRMVVAGWSDDADGGACEVSMAKYSGLIGINREESRLIENNRDEEGNSGATGEAKASTQNQVGEIFGIDRE